MSWRSWRIFSRLARYVKRAESRLKLAPVVIENNGRMLNEFLR